MHRPPQKGRLVWCHSASPDSSVCPFYIHLPCSNSSFIPCFVHPDSRPSVLPGKLRIFSPITVLVAGALLRSVDRGHPCSGGASSSVTHSPLLEGTLDTAGKTSLVSWYLCVKADDTPLPLFLFPCIPKGIFATSVSNCIGQLTLRCMS